jgi:hypothetical protein
MPSFLGVLGYIYMYIVIMVVLVFVVIQVGELVSFIVNPYHGVLAKLAYIAVMPFLVAVFTFSLYKIYGPEGDEEFVQQ